MPLFRSIGLAIFFVTVAIMMPKVFDEGQQTIISFLQGARLSADTASRITATAAASLPTPGTISSSSKPFPPLALPHTPTIPSY